MQCSGMDMKSRDMDELILFFIIKVTKKPKGIVEVEVEVKLRDWIGFML